MSCTVSPTVTPTVPYPNLIIVSVYNSAGELVKKVVSSPARGSLVSVSFTVTGGNGKDLTLGDSTLNIMMTGVEVPATYGTNITTVTWNGLNEQSQDSVPGEYYVSVQELDPYGHVNTITKEITVLDMRSYVELQVFNEGGELIRTIKVYTQSGTGYKLTAENIPDVLTLSASGGSSFAIKFTSDLSNSINWDGKNEAGVAVSNGVYEIKISMINDNLGSMSVTKTVVLLNAGVTDFVGNLKIVPNPYRGEAANGAVKIRWDGMTAGHARVMILDVSGALVRELIGPLEAGEVPWDTNNSAGKPVPNGIYIAIVEGKSAAGYLDRKTQKLAVLRSL